MEAVAQQDTTQQKERRNYPPPASEVSRDLELILRLVETLQAGPDRQQAAERLLRMMAHMLPDRKISMALGDASRCRIVVDSTLGLLASDSPLAIEIRDRWSSFPTGGEGVFWRLPLRGQRDQIAWLIVENETPFSESLKKLLGRSSDVLGDVLWSRPKSAFGFKQIWADQNNRTRIGLSCLILGLLLVFPAKYRIPCNAELLPLQQRLIAAPFDAQLDQCLVRPGDAVVEGQTLCQLDGRPLRIEREALLADYGQAKKEYDVALAAGKVADAQLAKLERERLHSRLKLIDERLDSLTIRCPINGIVVSGDLDKAKGIPFATGDTMFEVAPLNEMRFEVEIPEIDIGFVKANDEVHVRIAALGRSVSGQLDRIYPQSEVRDDKNVFVGVWQIQNERQDLRPGMEGSAVVYGPYRPFAWGWMRRSYEGVLRALGW